MLPEDFIDDEDPFICGNGSNSMLKNFPYGKNSMLGKVEAEFQCKKFCGTKKNCYGCNHQCIEQCEWIARTQCEKNKEFDDKSIINMSVKPGKL